MSEDFAHGSLPNAVNIPVTATHQDIKEFLNAVPRDVKIVVFCQSATCAYDEHVAQMIAQLNFQRVSVANEGFAEFAKLKLADDPNSPNASL
jgi:rhodanese-related sulfurtransferase